MNDELSREELIEFILNQLDECADVDYNDREFFAGRLYQLQVLAKEFDVSSEVFDERG